MSSSANVHARYHYGYDSNGNRNWQEGPVASANTVNLDILYAYDGLNRLTAYDRGDINGGHTAITTLTFAQQWTLDQLNNWSGFNEDTDGNAANDLVQSRTHNDANEITAITASTGSNWVDPTYDGAGNMLTSPTPGAETTTQKYIYDAWNRLVKVTDGSDVTQVTHGYDARSYRITKGVYAAGMLSQTRHYYHTDENQVVEERIDSSTDPDRQYTWGDRYIDDLVLRTRDTDANGSLDETVYALHDANWSVTALADTSGTVVERFRYDAYGKPLVLDANFANDANGISDYLWEYRFTGREWDTEPGLHYFRARYYDDAGGRFLQRDPIGYVDGMNLYAGYFVPSSVDPSGLDSVDALAGTLAKLAKSPQCKAEAKKIGQAIANTWNMNNPWYWPRLNDQRAKGYYCDQWASGYLDAFSHHSSGKCFTATVQAARVPGSQLVHFWLAITYVGPPPTTIYVDDGFGNGTYVHTAPPKPKGYTAPDSGSLAGCKAVPFYDCLGRKRGRPPLPAPGYMPGAPGAW